MANLRINSATCSTRKFWWAKRNSPLLYRPVNVKCARCYHIATFLITFPIMFTCSIYNRIWWRGACSWWRKEWGNPHHSQTERSEVGLFIPPRGPEDKGREWCSSILRVHVPFTHRIPSPSSFSEGLFHPFYFFALTLSFSFSFPSNCEYTVMHVTHFINECFLLLEWIFSKYFQCCSNQIIKPQGKALLLFVFHNPVQEKRLHFQVCICTEYILLLYTSWGLY